jgi:hypothetical protein
MSSDSVLRCISVADFCEVVEPVAEVRVSTHEVKQHEQFIARAADNETAANTDQRLQHIPSGPVVLTQNSLDPQSGSQHFVRPSLLVPN